MKKRFIFLIFILLFSHISYATVTDVVFAIGKEALFGKVKSETAKTSDGQEALRLAGFVFDPEGQIKSELVAQFCQERKKEECNLASLGLELATGNPNSAFLKFLISQLNVPKDAQQAFTYLLKARSMLSLLSAPSKDKQTPKITGAAIKQNQDCEVGINLKQQRVTFIKNCEIIKEGDIAFFLNSENEVITSKNTFLEMEEDEATLTFENSFIENKNFKLYELNGYLILNTQYDNPKIITSNLKLGNKKSTIKNKPIFESTNLNPFPALIYEAKKGDSLYNIWIKGRPINNKLIIPRKTLTLNEFKNLNKDNLRVKQGDKIYLQKGNYNFIAEKNKKLKITKDSILIRHIITKYKKIIQRFL